MMNREPIGLYILCQSKIEISQFLQMTFNQFQMHDSTRRVVYKPQETA